MTVGALRGTWLVARQEFRIRLRTGRWRWLLGVWIVVLALFTMLLDMTMYTGYGLDSDDSWRGIPLFGFLMFFVLGVMLIISPALTSQTINGDRERGTLAALQVTRLTPAEIALGKLVAGWAVGLVALALTLPFTAYAVAEGGLTVARVAAVYAVVAVLVGVVCAVSQAMSALLARSITSALLSYLVTATLTIGTVIAFALVAPLMTETRYNPNRFGSSYDEVVRLDRVWWLLAPNPFVVLADSTPRAPARITGTGDSVSYDDYDPLSALGRLVRELRDPPLTDDRTGSRGQLPVWPYGMAFNVLLGVGSVVVTSRRLRMPAGRLASRIA